VEGHIEAARSGVVVASGEEPREALGGGEVKKLRSSGVERELGFAHREAV
jgi:hypothetical protein